MFCKVIKTREDFYNERERLEKIIQTGIDAQAELDGLEHQYNWAIFSNKSVEDAFTKKEI